MKPSAGHENPLNGQPAMSDEDLAAVTIGPRVPLNSTIHLAPYDPTWASQFLLLAGRVRHALAGGLTGTVGCRRHRMMRTQCPCVLDLPQSIPGGPPIAGPQTMAGPPGVSPAYPLSEAECESSCRFATQPIPAGPPAVVDGTDDFINTYGYDNLGRLTSTQQVAHQGGNSVAEKRVDFAYNAAGRYESITRYTDITQTDLVAATTFTYDEAQRLTGLSHDQGMTNLADYAWTFDTSGRITSVTTVDGTDAYAYDDTGQLVGVDSTYQTDETFSYDANGNRTIAGYTTGAGNRLLSDGTSNYEYDAEGNRTKKTDISTGDYVEYAWDHRNRLTSVTFRNSSDVKTKQVTYVYDVFDRRIAKSVDIDGNGTIDSGETYVYDGTDIALVFDETDALLERLFYGPGVDQPLASEDAAGDVLWFLTDNQGTIRDVAEYDAVSNTTSVVNHLTYGGFGQITAQTNASYEPRHTYTGREYDADSELFYYRARWYDATVGRFISEDPIGFTAGDANLSRYVGNSSTNFIDPSGLVLIAIDGTGSKRFLLSQDGVDPATKRYRSHVRNFWGEYVGSRPGEKAYYYDGPESDHGLESRSRLTAALARVLEEMERDPCQKINIVGHSRGGYVAIELAAELGRRGHRVNFLGLYDPVDMDISINRFDFDSRIPTNVDYAYVAMRSPRAGSRELFNTVDAGAVDVSQMKGFQEKYFFGTHAAMGGAPGITTDGTGILFDGTHVTVRQDIAAAARVDKWIRQGAETAGIKFGPYNPQ